jgi:hypothetical protein
LATLGDAVGDVLGDVGDVVGGVVGGGSGSGTGSGNGTTTGGQASGNLTARSAPFVLQQGILYSVNDYTGNTHRNRILERDGTIVDQSLDNEGHVYNAQVVGDYKTLMTFTGHVRDGVVIDGLPVVATRVISEVEGGGSSTISGEGDD